MTILCGTDLSEPSRAAIRASAALAGALDEPLWIAHATGDTGASLDGPLREMLRSAAATSLEREASGIAAVLPGAKTRVMDGAPPAALLATAGELRAGLVVVASAGHGASPLYRVGGTSERLAASAKVPVLVVRDPAPFEAWRRRERPLRVVVGVSFSASAAAAIRWARSLAAGGPCELVAVHLYYADEARGRYGGARGGGAISAPELVRLLERDVATFVGPGPEGGALRVRAEEAVGRLADLLVEIAASERADLLVVGTRRHRAPARLWSVSAGALHLSRAAVATVPAAPGARTPIAPARVSRILVAVDLTAASELPVALAYSLLRGRGGEVHLLHVEDGPKEHPPEGSPEERLRGLVPPEVGREGISTKVEIAHGPIARVIREVSERLGADLVCVGARPRSMIQRPVLGSVVDALLRECDKPILIARPPPP